MKAKLEMMDGSNLKMTASPQHMLSYDLHLCSVIIIHLPRCIIIMWHWRVMMRRVGRNASGLAAVSTENKTLAINDWISV